ncbi:MAG: hypothetical protein ABI685_09005 [Ferruginibacter sp.]
MKKLFGISLLFFLSVSLCSCPYSSAYNLDETPGIYVEDILIGNWMAYIKKPNSSREEAVYVSLSKKTDLEYNISFSGNLDELSPYKKNTDSLSGTAFMSTVGGRQFFNIKINSRIYIAQLTLKGDKLSILPLAEHFTGKMIFNSDALRNSVDFHYKTRVHPILDDDFCLRDMVKTN